MNQGFGALSIVTIQWIIVVITVLFGLIDLQTQKIPNLLNLLLFGLLLVLGIPLAMGNLELWLINLLVVTFASYSLYGLGVLGGGDCKYLMALSPVMKWDILAQVLVLSMAIFILVYAIKSIYFYFKNGMENNNPVFVREKMPFMWAFIPSFVVMLWI